MHGHVFQLQPQVLTPAFFKICDTQTRIKHAETGILPQDRFGRPHGRADLFGAQRKIGMGASFTGPAADAAESGRYQTQGAKLAAGKQNKAGGVLGRPIGLVIEDDQKTTNPGSVPAFSKLAGDKDISAFIGPIYSTQIHAIAPDIQRLGKQVMIGVTDPQLTHMGNPWLFRFRPNDIYSARVIADYGMKTLGKKKWQSCTRPTTSAPMV
jgi:branched-chain amino acid transport system substrate-binding protein